MIAPKNWFLIKEHRYWFENSRAFHKGLSQKTQTNIA